jgi:hypothetical protein
VQTRVRLLLRPPLYGGKVCGPKQQKRQCKSPARECVGSGPSALCGGTSKPDTVEHEMESPAAGAAGATGTAGTATANGRGGVVTSSWKALPTADGGSITSGAIYLDVDASACGFRYASSPSFLA